MNLNSKILLLSLLATTVGCQTNTVSIQSVTVKPNIVPTLIYGGLGVDFDMQEGNVISLGFKKRDELERNYVYEKVDMNDTFVIQKVSFTPISRKIYSISGVKYYQKEDVNNNCFRDKSVIEQAILEKYKNLLPVKSAFANLRKEGFQYNQWCESKTNLGIAGVYEEQGLQRCVSLTCSTLDNHFSLEISYTDSDLMSLSFKEYEIHKKNINNELLKKLKLNREKI